MRAGAVKRRPEVDEGIAGAPHRSILTTTRLIATGATSGLPGPALRMQVERFSRPAARPEHAPSLLSQALERTRYPATPPLLDPPELRGDCERKFAFRYLRYLVVLRRRRSPYARTSTAERQTPNRSTERLFVSTLLEDSGLRPSPPPSPNPTPIHSLLPPAAPLLQNTKRLAPLPSARG